MVIKRSEGNDHVKGVQVPGSADTPSSPSQIRKGKDIEGRKITEANKENVDPNIGTEAHKIFEGCRYKREVLAGGRAKVSVTLIKVTQEGTNNVIKEAESYIKRKKDENRELLDTLKSRQPGAAYVMSDSDSESSTGTVSDSDSESPPLSVDSDDDSSISKSSRKLKKKSKKPSPSPEKVREALHLAHDILDTQLVLQALKKEAKLSPEKFTKTQRLEIDEKLRLIKPLASKVSEAIKSPKYRGGRIKRLIIP